MKSIDDLNFEELHDLGYGKNMTREYARKLFPLRPEKYVYTARQLQHYACNKWIATKCLREGEQEKFKMYINIVARIYCDLPIWATGPLDF